VGRIDLEGMISSRSQLADTDDTVTLRRDMRNAAGGLLIAPLSISSPEGNVGSDLVAVPNPITGGTNDR
jgi:hypothetical protein